MPSQRPRPTDADLQRYLEARAGAAASEAAGTDMVQRVAVRVGLVQRPRQPRTIVLRLAVAVAALVALLAVGFGSGVLQLPDSSPIPVPTRSPEPSPTALQALADVPYPGVAIAATEDAVWVSDARGELAELDPSTGAVLRRVSMPRPAEALLITLDSVWASTGAGDLLRIDRATLGITSIVGATGIALAATADAIWLGGDDEVVRIDLTTNAISLRVPIAERSADLGLAASDTAIWVASRTQIVRLDPASGETTATVPGDASRLAVAGDAVWATRGQELLRIDPVAPVIDGRTSGMPGSSSIAVFGDRVWVAGPPGGGPSGSLVGVAHDVGRIEVAGEIPASVRDLAVGAGGIWITTDADDVPAQIFRFAVPST